MFLKFSKLTIKTEKPDRWLTVIHRDRLEKMLGGEVSLQVLISLDGHDQEFSSGNMHDCSRALLCISGNVVVRVKNNDKTKEIKLDAEPQSSFNSLLVVPTGPQLTIISDPELANAHASVMLWVTGPTEAHSTVSSGSPAPAGTWFFPSEIARRLTKPIVCEYMNSMHPDVEAGHHFHKNKHEVLACLNGMVDVGLANVDSGQVDHARLGEHETNRNRTITVPPHWAHAVKNISSGMSSVWVWATAEPRVESDDFDFTVPQRTTR